MALGAGLGPWFGAGPGLVRGWFLADVVGRDVLWARMFLCGEASCAQRNILRVGEHFAHRVTDCAEGNQSRLFSAQNVPLCTKCSVTCDRPWGRRGRSWCPAGFVRPPGLPVGYLGRTRRHRGRHGLRRLRAQAIRAAGAGDGVTGAGGVVRDDRRTRRQKAGDGQAHLLPGAPEESRTRRQNGGRGYSSGLCYCWRGMVPGPPSGGRTTPLRWCWQGCSGGVGGHVRGLRCTGAGGDMVPGPCARWAHCAGAGGGAVTERPQVARTVGMALSRYQVQKARRAGTSVCSSGCQFRAPAAALAQL